jgi:type II secretory pathway component PulF
MHAHVGNSALPLLALLDAGTSADFFAHSALWILFFLVPVMLAGYAVYCGFSTPLRRQERARVFLDLLEAGFRQGQRPETALAQAAQSNDPSLGRSFQRLAARLRQGLRLSQALEEVPKLLPPQVAALLRVGEEAGDLRKVLPACRGLLRDAQSQTRNGFNYLVITCLVIMPIMPILIWTLNTMVFPKFLEILYGYSQPVPAITLLVMRTGYWVAGVQLAIALCLCCWIGFYVRGPRAYGYLRVDGQKTPRRPIFRKPIFDTSGYSPGSLRTLFGIRINPLGSPDLWQVVGRVVAPLRDRILFALPWRRRRLQRDFCATLSLLLDAGTPERAAVALAAEGTASHVFIRRARRALADLAAGKPLREALRQIDQAGEFSWRLANAAEHPDGFLPALSGWMDALEAKAFQQEQTASQLITTGLVLCNGLVVGLIAAGIFTVLISLEQ